MTLMMIKPSADWSSVVSAWARSNEAKRKARQTKSTRPELVVTGGAEDGRNSATKDEKSAQAQPRMSIRTVLTNTSFDIMRSTPVNAKARAFKDGRAGRSAQRRRISTCEGQARSSCAKEVSSRKARADGEGPEISSEMSRGMVNVEF